MKYVERAVRCDTDNGFDQKLFDVMCRTLEDGHKIWLYCWCTGHTKTAMVEAEYLEALRNKYGDRFVYAKEKHEADSWLDCYELED